MSIVLEHLSKVFGSHTVVNDVSLEIHDGELFVLLGPSGSGKSTVLRQIAGLLDVDGGRVLLHGRDVTDVPPQRRDVGFVFQHYALFRHMTVADNIEFPLKIRRLNRVARRRRRNELLDVVGLVGFEERYPHQLSGGQQQRVALARSLAHRPEVLLLDEPFGALDAKIRADLRRSLRRIQAELGVTTIFVTHDQEEAFELADRMGVMNFGRLLEVGAPMELYLRPQTEFVATFLGRANLMVGECTPTSVRLGAVEIPLDGRIRSAGEERRVQVLFRPEDVAVKDSPEALAWPLLGRAQVDEAEFIGTLEKIRLRLPPLSRVRAIAPEAPFGADYLLVEAIRSGHQARRFPLRPGDHAWVGVRRIHALLHPGMSFLLASDGSPAGAAALRLGGEIARLAHARVTMLGLGVDETVARAGLEQARERVGSGPAALELRTAAEAPARALAREVDRRHYDLLFYGTPVDDLGGRVAEILASGDHHLMLVPDARPAPRRVLICAAVGEPGKHDVLFSGRLVRHLGAAAAILTVMAEWRSEQAVARGQRFLDAGARTLASVGVAAETLLRRGETRQQIFTEVTGGGYDLIVLGAPAPGPNGQITISHLMRDLLEGLRDRLVLIVRSGAPTREEPQR